MTRLLGWLLGLDTVSGFDEIEPSLSAAWAQDGAFWVFLGAVLLVAFSIVFYFRFQPKGSSAARLALAVCRGLILALLLITLEIGRAHV